MAFGTEDQLRAMGADQAFLTERQAVADHPGSRDAFIVPL
jgi:hypothetical protein